jgi:hypothetical protein
MACWILLSADSADLAGLLAIATAFRLLSLLTDWGFGYLRVFAAI